jgi:hypothetical protein
MGPVVVVVVVRGAWVCVCVSLFAPEHIIMLRKEETYFASDNAYV